MSIAVELELSVREDRLGDAVDISLVVSQVRSVSNSQVQAYISGPAAPPGKHALRFRRADNTVIAESVRFSNVLLNLKPLWPKLLVEVAAPAMAIGASPKDAYEAPLLLAISILLVLKALLAVSTVRVQDLHARLLLHVARYHLEGYPCDLRAFASAAAFLQCSEEEMTAALTNLERLALVRWSRATSEVRLVDRVLVLPASAPGRRDPDDGCQSAVQSKIAKALPNANDAHPRCMSQARVQELHQAALELSLAGCRSALLGDVDPLVAASLPIMPDESSQLLSDLQLLNAIQLVDGSWPLASWLSSALTLRKSHRQSDVLRRALGEIKAQS